jgi:hypothetical protein
LLEIQNTPHRPRHRLLEGALCFTGRVAEGHDDRTRVELRRGVGRRSSGGDGDGGVECAERVEASRFGAEGEIDKVQGVGLRVWGWILGFGAGV